MMEEINNPYRIEMRRYRSMMDISSLGIFAFGIWSIAKLVLTTIYEPAQMLADSTTGEALSAGSDVINIVTMVVLCAVDLLMRLYVTTSARKVSKGRKKKTRYIVFAVLLLLGSLINIAFNIGVIVLVKTDIADSIIRIIVEITSMGAVIELIYATRKFRTAWERANSIEGRDVMSLQEAV